MLSEKLKQLGIEIPKISGPFGAYVPARRAGELIFVSGQLPMKNGSLIASGAVPSVCPVETAKSAARQCVINALSAAASVCGSLDDLSGVIRIGVFVCSDNSFTQQPAVANGASELLLELFGEEGKHARAAVGVNVLPLGAAVEAEFVFTTK